MAEITLTASTGRPTGSRASGRLRAEGKVPATVYGLGKDAVSVTVDWRELRQVLTTDAGLNAVIQLSIDGGGDELTIVKDLQRHAIRRNVMHIDLLRVSADVAIEIEVPITLVGEAKAVVNNDGMVEQAMYSLTVLAKPGAIPDELTLDISALEIGHSLRVSDIALPDGVETHVDPEEPVAIGAGMQAEEVAEAVEGEGAEGEGAGAEGAADGDGGGDTSGDGDGEG
jgi:large subunit ribosomal protein L25